MKIGIISDTHDFLDPKVAGIFQGVSHILHAGDICSASIIFALEAVAPVTAVLGNNDIGLAFRETESLVLAGRKFLIHHIVNPVMPQAIIKGRIAVDPPDVVVFGHTHQAFAQNMGGIFYLNPGYAGKPRFRMERSVVLLDCDAKELVPEFVTL